MNIGKENRTCFAFSSGLLGIHRNFQFKFKHVNFPVFGKYWNFWSMDVDVKHHQQHQHFLYVHYLNQFFIFFFFSFQKIIQSYVKTPILHCYFGTLLPVDIDPKAKYVYFLRRSIAKIGKITHYCIHRVLVFTHISITTNFSQIVLLIMICICGSLFILTMFDVVTHSPTFVQNYKKHLNNAWWKFRTGLSLVL